MQILRDISKSKLFFSIKLLFGVCKRSSELTKMPFLYNLHPEKTGSNKKQVPVNFSNSKSWINISFGIPTIVPLLTLFQNPLTDFLYYINIQFFFVRLFYCSKRGIYDFYTQRLQIYVSFLFFPHIDGMLSCCCFK